MAKESFKQPKAASWAAGLVVVSTVTVIGCGSSPPAAPPGQGQTAVAQAAPTATPPSMMPGAGAHSAHGSSPNMAAAQSMPGSHGMPGTPSSSDPAAMMKAHAPPSAGNAHASTSSPNMNDPQAMMKAHMQANPGNATAGGTTPNMSDPQAMMKAHTQGAPGSATPGSSTPNMSDPQAMMKAHMQANPGNATAGAATAPAHGGVAGPGGAVPGGQVPPGAIAAMQPGQFPGSGQGPGGPQGPGGQSPNFPKGSAEEAVMNFCIAIAEDNLTAASDYVSTKAKGQLVQIRDGTIADDKLDAMKPSMVLSTLRLNSTRSFGGGKLISLSNSKNEVLSFTLFKEGEAYKLREFKISAIKPGLMQNNNF